MSLAAAFSADANLDQLFSALYSMLPSSKRYLIKSGYSPKAAAWILLVGFMGGFIGIQIVSRFLHHYIPSHVVDCDHNHDDAHDGHHDHSGVHHTHSRRHSHHFPAETGNASESTPLLAENGLNGKIAPFVADGAGSSKYPLEIEVAQADGARSRGNSRHSHSGRRRTPASHHSPTDRRPSMVEVQKRVISFVKDTKTNCDSNGPCYGYSDPCGQECFKHISARVPSTSRQHVFLRTATGMLRRASTSPLPSPHNLDDEMLDVPALLPTSSRITRAHTHTPFEHDAVDEACESDSSEDLEAQHHHHVPENAFMSIGLQTSIAIALHKLPEGFITYATNHANPTLGFSVFMALFVHNITEGFAMALPLFLALNSRFRAMFWASLLGGVSQPLGAGIAAAWFKIAGHEGHKPGEAVYGCMFAITAGIMASVALQLFVESLSLNHNRNLCIAFAFIGMAIMGMSNALTA